jgi:hypothetical protein
MATLNLQDSGAYLEDFMTNLTAFCEVHREELAAGPTQPLRGIYHSSLQKTRDFLVSPAYPSIILVPLGWEEESQTSAERYLRLQMEIHIFYSGLQESQRLAGLIAWADKVVQTFIEHRKDFQGNGAAPYLYDLILTPLELLPGEGLVSSGKFLVIGLKKAKK